MIQDFFIGVPAGHSVPPYRHRVRCLSVQEFVDSKTELSIGSLFRRTLNAERLNIFYYFFTSNLNPNSFN